jgi:hypothetical protein
MVSRISQARVIAWFDLLISLTDKLFALERSTLNLREAWWLDVVGLAIAPQLLQVVQMPAMTIHRVLLGSSDHACHVTDRAR